MPVGLLSYVQLHQTHAEVVHLPDQVQQEPVRDVHVAHLPERVVARHERFQELLFGANHTLVRGVERVSLAGDHLLQRLACVVQLVAHLREDHAVGFFEGDGAPEVAVVAALAHLVHVAVRLLVRLVQDGARARREGGRAPPHGQREDQLLDLREVQVDRGDARQVHDVARALGGDVGVAVAVAAHPRREAHDRVVEGDPGQTLVLQRGVDALAELRVPREDGVVEVRQARAHLVLRLRGVAADLVRAPRRLNRARHAAEQLGAFVPGEARPLQVQQVPADAPEVLEHRATQRLCGVRGEHQVHLLLAQRGVNLLGGGAPRDQALDGAVGGLRRPARDVIQARVALLHRARDVLGDVVQVEDVGEGGREHHALLLVQAPELVRERLEVGVALALVELLRELVHGDQRLVKVRAGGLLDDAEEQRAQQVVGLLKHHVVVECFLLAGTWWFAGAAAKRTSGGGESKKATDDGFRASGGDDGGGGGTVRNAFGGERVGRRGRRAGHYKRGFARTRCGSGVRARGAPAPRVPRAIATRLKKA